MPTIVLIVIVIVRQFANIEQKLLIHLLALDESDVKEGAGLFSGYVRDEKETLSHFDHLRSSLDVSQWDLQELHSFCKTRRVGYCDTNGKQLGVPELLVRIRTQLELESRAGRSTYIHCPRRSQLPYRKRRLRLVQSGILNVDNCPRLVKVEVPSKQDSRWQYVCCYVFA